MTSTGKSQTRTWRGYRRDLPGVTDENRKQSLGIGIVAEGSIEMHEQVTISRSEDEAGPKLEGVHPEPMLPEPVGLRPHAGFTVRAEEDVEQVSGFQLRGFVSDPLGINK